MSQNPAFRSHAFVAIVGEWVYPGGTASRLHRNLVRHGRRIGNERLGTDPWQLESGMWFATEAERLEAEQSAPANTLALDNSLPF